MEKINMEVYKIKDKEIYLKYEEITKYISKFELLNKNCLKQPSIFESIDSITTYGCSEK